MRPNKHYAGSTFFRPKDRRSPNPLNAAVKSNKVLGSGTEDSWSVKLRVRLPTPMVGGQSMN